MSQYRMLVYGALLVFLMIFRPNGLFGGLNFTELALKAIGRKPLRKGKLPNESN
jgi:branched-chain amino acid transport system permease protein